MNCSGNKYFSAMFGVGQKTLLFSSASYSKYHYPEIRLIQGPIEGDGGVGFSSVVCNRDVQCIDMSYVIDKPKLAYY